MNWGKSRLHHKAVEVCWTKNINIVLVWTDYYFKIIDRGIIGKFFKLFAAVKLKSSPARVIRSIKVGQVGVSIQLYDRREIINSFKEDITIIIGLKSILLINMGV